MRAFDLPGRSPVYATNGMIATSHPLGSATALSVLREGGNAMDAALAASATLLAVEPHMTGIGGDCFAIVAEPDGRVHAINGSGRAPKNAHLEWFIENGIDSIDITSPHAVTTPGALRAWEKLHARFGSFDWERLFADSVGYSRDGFPVAPRVARDWSLLEEKISAHEGGRKHLLFDGKVPVTGQRIAFPALADAVERIAKEGVSAFYEGMIAQEIAETVQALGGFLSEEDLAECKADWVEPISTRFRGHDILQIPPNGQGITALILLNMLEDQRSDFAPVSPERMHQAIEYARIGYAVRDAHVADIAHMKTPVEQLLSPEMACNLAAQFDPKRRNPAIEVPTTPGSNTIYLSVVDRDGMAVSFINSVFSGFGTGIVTPKTGIVLQNRGSGFAIKGGHPNTIGPGKRPLHTIIPSMVMKDGKPTHVFGVMGGAYQAAGHAYVLQNLFDFGMDPQEALDCTRVFWDPAGNILAESGMSENIFNALESIGHPMQRGGLHGGGQIIRIDRDSGVLIGASDPRKDGHAAGY
jgi:gamma-glutamyltranspeptidase/glutathione hydrolase